MTRKGKGEKEVKEPLFVGLNNPIEMRRGVLESTKDVVEVLQRFERFKAVREEKITTISKLKDEIKEISRLLAKVKRDIPNVNVRVKSHEEAKVLEEKPKPKKKKQEKKPAAKPKAIAINDLEKLESELSSIEQKLGKI